MAVKKSELYPMLWEACNKLRGGVEPARYKDYVLILLFFKYVTDRYKGKTPFENFKVGEGASFDDLIEAKGKPDVGVRVDEILKKFLNDNELKDELPVVSFNNTDALGSPTELQDRVSDLIGVFQNPEIDFKNNRASGDDIIGDAYEYLMMKFAQESGKSKGQFYTPSEVSRIIARLIGIGDIKQTPMEKRTLYDPAAGSGSLLIRAADEASADVSIYGQEKDFSTAGLAKMNLILHQKETGDIKKGSTLSTPAFTDTSRQGQLRKFDFIVMNPPFSDKSWSDGIKPSEDKFKRFDGYGIPPEKNGDYAWFLHVLKSLKSDGKAGIVMPHGILFRGNAEEKIRVQILKRHYIKGIVSLPANLFFGTGIPACIVVIDKENADERDGIFLIDASRGYKKDGNKNRLREQDIEKIVQTFTKRTEIPGYSRFVTYTEILDENDGNLNVHRYISKIDDTLPQNISAHLRGGIPSADVDSLEQLWEISPALKRELFSCNDAKHETYNLALPSEEIESAIGKDNNVFKEKQRETETIFSGWKSAVKEILLGINAETNPKEIIRALGGMLLNAYEPAWLLDKYDVFDCLMNYWNEKLQDDVYAIKVSGYEVGREIECENAQKKTKDEGSAGESKVKSFEGALIPREIIETLYFSDECTSMGSLVEQSLELEAELIEMREEESGDEGLLKEALNAKGDDITKTSLNKRLKELELKKTSKVMEAMKQLAKFFDKGNIAEMEILIQKMPELNEFDIRKKNGEFGKGKINAAMKLAVESAVVPDVYKDEYNALSAYGKKLYEKDAVDKKIKEVQKALDDKVKEKYVELSINEIKHLLFDLKWMARLQSDIQGAAEKVLNSLSSKVLLIAKRYEHTLGELEEQTEKSRDAVIDALERMGYTW